MDRANSEYADEHALRAWTAADITWGIFNVPEQQLGVLGDVRGLDVIELGCGTACFSAWLTRRGARPTGVDVTPAQLESARHCQGRFGISFPLIPADAADVPLPPASFDLAISECGASLWCDPARARRGVTPCAMRLAVTGASEREDARTGDRVALMPGQQVEGAASVRVALRRAGAIDPARAVAARRGEDAGAASELRRLGDGHGKEARVGVDAEDLEVLREAEQVRGALPEDRVVAAHALGVTGLRWQLDDLADAGEDAVGPDVTGELDAHA